MDPRSWNQELVRRRTLLKGMGGLAGAIVLAGCGGDDDAGASPGTTAPGATGTDPGTTPGTTGSSPATSAAPATTAAPQGPTRGGSLSIATPDGLARDLFVGNSFGPQAHANNQLAWGLFRYKSGEFATHPGLAEGYAVSPDALTHTITMRPGITFHDGSPITAVEAVANLRAALFPDDPLRDAGSYGMVPLSFGGFPGIVDSIDVVDEATLEIKLNTPRANLRGPLAALLIMNPAVLANVDYGNDVGALRDAGSGPFRIEAFAPGEFVEYSRFESFIEEAYLDQLRLQLIPDPAARFLALKGGQVQAAFGLSKADWDASVGDPAYSTHIAPPEINAFMGFNATKNQLLAENEKLRRALAMSMNREAYVQSFWGNDLAQVATQIALVPGVNGYNPDLDPIPYDPEAAKALIAETGLSPEELTFSVINPPAFGGVPELAAMLEAIAADFSEIGVTLEVNITDVAGWLAGGADHDMQVGPYGNSGGGLEPSVVGLYLNRGEGRTTIPDAELYRERVVQALAATNTDEQGALLRDVLADAAEHVAGIPIAYGANAALASANVHDMSTTIAHSYDTTWIES